VELYEKLFTQNLRVSEDFLEENRDVIRARLRHAAEEFERDHGNIFAINMCLHAASSVILSHPDYLGETLKVVRETEGLRDKDPTTVVTVSGLYQLLRWDAARAASETTEADYEAKLKKLRSGFDKINWLIGPDAMRVLGIRKGKD
jgi:hypothetical protein